MIEPRRHEAHEVFVSKYTFEDLSREIVDCFFQVHKKLGSGLLESLYEEPVCIELDKKGLFFEVQKEIPVFYDGKKLKNTCRLDIVVEKQVILELKAVERILPVHEAQIITYLKITGLNLGFLVNFHDPYFKTSIKRFVL
jgi:GxxExxY protein